MEDNDIFPSNFIFLFIRSILQLSLCYVSGELLDCSLDVILGFSQPVFS